MSYHDRIQRAARMIEKERGKSYVQPEEKTLPMGWSLREHGFLYGAIYKLIRVAINTKDLHKALDDVIDAYNFCALFYEEAICRIGGKSEGGTKEKEPESNEQSKENLRSKDISSQKQEDPLAYTILSPVELEMIELESDSSRSSQDDCQELTENRFSSTSWGAN